MDDQVIVLAAQVIFAQGSTRSNHPLGETIERPGVSPRPKEHHGSAGNPGRI